MAVLRLLVKTFVTNTSMRGFLKLHRTRHLSLRLVWTIYLISMISLLATASYYLVTHYLSFHVTEQQSERLQEATRLPSIAVCSERPIGDHAADWWRNGSIVSPLRLHRAMRASMRLAYNASRGGRSLGKFFAAKDLFYADKISTYFQNLGVEDSRRVGVQSDDLVLFCLMRHSANGNPSVSHDEICKLTVRWVRHPLYMNCYDITIVEEVSTEVSSVSLILRSGLAPQSEADMEQAQVFDLFTQSVGMRIALHDPGSFPNIDEHGVSVGLGRNTQLRYSLIRHRRLDIGGEHSSCLSKSKVDGAPPLVDFDQRYSYSFFACMSQEIGRLILSECGCVSAGHLVAAGAKPNNRTPFCDRHSAARPQDLARRLDCVRNIKAADRIRRLRTGRCFHRCEFNRYRLQISSSRWIPTQWQLKLILDVSPAWDAAVSKSATRSERAAANRKLSDFTASDRPGHRVVNVSDLDLSRLTLVTVTRSSYNTLYKSEALQITLSTLLAQIGGMGSLTIGLTLTFFFEIVELALLLLLGRGGKDKDQKAAKDKEQQLQPLDADLRPTDE